MNASFSWPVPYKLHTSAFKNEQNIILALGGLLGFHCFFVFEVNDSHSVASAEAMILIATELNALYDSTSST